MPFKLIKKSTKHLSHLSPNNRQQDASPGPCCEIEQEEKHNDAVPASAQAEELPSYPSEDHHDDLEASSSSIPNEIRLPSRRDSWLDMSLDMLPGRPLDELWTPQE